MYATSTTNRDGTFSPAIRKEGKLFVTADKFNNEDTAQGYAEAFVRNIVSHIDSEMQDAGFVAAE